MEPSASGTPTRSPARSPAALREGIVLYVESAADTAGTGNMHAAAPTPTASYGTSGSIKDNMKTPLTTSDALAPLPPPPPPPAPAQPSSTTYVDAKRPPNSSRDYVARRMEYWTSDDASATRMLELGAIRHLPLRMQAAFRRKMLAIFALQLTLVLGLVSASAFYAPVRDVVKSAFAVDVVYLVAAGGVVVALLVLLYAIRALFPLNWLVLLVFSVAQAALFAALGVKFDTYLGVFNCGATLACVLVMLALAGVRRGGTSGSGSSQGYGGSGVDVDGVESGREGEGEGEARLLSSVVAGLIAFVVMALVATALYVRFGREFVTPEGFAASLAFQFVLVLWFAFDASTMYRVMSPDEYMHGVIYFYTDMVLLVVICAVAVGVVAAFAAMAAACEDGCDCGACSCDGCKCDGCSSGDCGCGGCDICGCNTSTSTVCGMELGFCECNPCSPCDSRWTWADVCFWTDFLTDLCNCLCLCCDTKWSCCGTSGKSQSPRRQQRTVFEGVGHGPPDPDVVARMQEPLWEDPSKGKHSGAVTDLEMQRI